MDVIALVGPSGTGKSHRALWVAQKNGADAIIDDGILIKDGKVIGGYSAKKEKNRIMAVRRAIFILPGHASDVRRAIAESHPRRILILGTSENMVQKIAKALRIGPVSKIIRIEDIASKKDMELAQYHRLKKGEHIIPVPNSNRIFPATSSTRSRVSSRLPRQNAAVWENAPLCAPCSAIMESSSSTIR